MLDARSIADKPRLILHIGTEKTGTTFIQQFLSRNRRALAEQGIHTPQSLDNGGGAHSWMPILCYKENRVDDLVREQRFSSTAYRFFRILQKKRELCAEVQAISGMSPTWVITSEHLQSRLRDEEELLRLRNIVDEVFGRVEILLYIRRPVLTAISLWSTVVKNGAVHHELPAPKISYFSNICSHRATIERWRQCFGDARLSVRLFDPACFVGGSLVEDFCHAVGIVGRESLECPAPANEALSFKGIQYLSYLNEWIPRLSGTPSVPSRWDLVRLIARQTAQFPRFRPTPEQVAAYEEAFAESCHWVRANYFPDRDVLWPTPLTVESDPDASARRLTIEETALLQALAEAWSPNHGADPACMPVAG